MGNGWDLDGVPDAGFHEAGSALVGPSHSRALAPHPFPGDGTYRVLGV